MAQQTINIGASPNDGTGTPLRTAFQYTNSNFSELYTALGGGSGLPGSSGQVIFNDGGTNLAGDTGLTFNKTTDTLGTGRLTTSGDAIVCSSTGDFYVGTTLSPQFKVERATGAATITGDLTVDTSVFKVNTTTDQVGIGTATPTSSTRLDVVGGTFARFNKGAANQYHLRIGNSAKDYGLYVDIDNNGTNGFALYDITAGVDTFRYVPGASGSWTHYINGTTAMTLNSTGLGVGVVPASLAGFGTTLRQKGVGAAGGIFTENNTGASWFGIYSGTSLADSAALIYPSGGTLRFATTTSVGVGGFATQMTLDASGNLLVGTTSALSSVSGSSQIALGGAGLQTTSQAISAATATTICRSGSGGVAIVAGYNGTGQYSAIVLFKYGGTATSVIGSINDTGSTITYAISGANLQITSSLALTNLTVTCIRTA